MQASLPPRPSVSKPVPAYRSPERLQALGLGVLRVGSVLLLGWIGLFKFTPTEAEGIRPLLEHSWVLGWLLPAFGTLGASYLIGGIELATAALLLAGWRWPRADTWGGLGLALTALVTLSFLFSTPGMFGTVDGLYVPTAGAFVLKDLLLLGTGLLLMARGARGTAA